MNQVSCNICHKLLAEYPDRILYPLRKTKTTWNPVLIVTCPECDITRKVMEDDTEKVV